ncbi:MAG TPA: ATP-binding cassette domain-containing protein [Conexibacter sp.]|jgi:ABC-type multidrug transport system ATPase subunit
MRAPLLALRNVTRAFSRGPYELPVLRHVSLKVDAGQVVGVFGQRAAGKTTLLKIAAGLEAPDAGTVQFDGRDVGALSRREAARVLRHEVGWVERAGPASEELTVFDWLRLPLLGRDRGEARRRSHAALERLGVRDCADEPWRNLADGERVHVALAQALVREPRLLVVDDPTAGLDLIERERVVSLLHAVADDGVGVLIAAPDLHALRRADEVFSLAGGGLVGPPDPPPEERGAVIDFPGRRSA